MTLFKQIAIVMSLLVLILLAVTMASNYRSTSEFIRDQLYSNARNTASSLGLAISKSAGPDDLAMAETMINAVFDSGYYERIVYTDMDGKVLYERKVPLKIKDVPQWFVDRVRLESREATVPVSRQWRMIGELSIAGHRGHAYEQLWQAFKEVVTGFAVLSLLALAAIYFLLKTVLRSLERVREQAEAVVGSRFVIQEKIPRTTEFRDVVQAMNSLVMKVKEIYRRESEAIARYNELLYRDKETGFYNRNYFRIKLDGFLRAHDRFSEGFVLAFQIRDYDDLHKTLGPNAVHETVLRLRDAVETGTESVHDAVRCRLRESDIMVILPSVRKETAMAVAGAVAEHCSGHECPLTAAVTAYHAGETLGEVLSETDNALMLAAAEEGVFFYEGRQSRLPALGHDAWVRKIRAAMEAGAFVPMLQPVMNPWGIVVQEELLLRLETDGEIYSAGEFMPVVSGVGMLLELDRYVIAHLEKIEGPGTIAVNVSWEFVSHTSSLHWLDTFTRKWKERKLSVTFEMPGGSVARDPEAAEAFAAHVQSRGWGFGIDHFTVGSEELEVLQAIKPDYLKIEAAYLSSLLEEGNDEARTSALFTIAELLDIRLVATGVDSGELAAMLREKGIEWLLGFGISEAKRKEWS